MLVLVQRCDEREDVVLHQRKIGGSALKLRLCHVVAGVEEHGLRARRFRNGICHLLIGHLDIEHDGDFLRLDVVDQRGDRRGGRLGRGKGFYDRFLSGLDRAALGLGMARPPRWGYAYSWQTVEAVPAESHDLSMDAVITDAGAFRPEI